MKSPYNFPFSVGSTSISVFCKYHRDIYSINFLIIHHPTRLTCNHEGVQDPNPQIVSSDSPSVRRDKTSSSFAFVAAPLSVAGTICGFSPPFINFFFWVIVNAFAGKEIIIEGRSVFHFKESTVDFVLTYALYTNGTSRHVKSDLNRSPTVKPDIYWIKIMGSLLF